MDRGTSVALASAIVSALASLLVLKGCVEEEIIIVGTSSTAGTGGGAGAAGATTAPGGGGAGGAGGTTSSSSSTTSSHSGGSGGTPAPSGSLDATWAPGSDVPGITRVFGAYPACYTCVPRFLDMALAASGKVTVAGYSDAERPWLVRFNPTGNLDSTFGSGGKFQPNPFNGGKGYFSPLALDGNNRGVTQAVPKTTGTCYVARTSSAGQIDTLFGNSGYRSTDRLFALTVHTNGAVLGGGNGLLQRWTSGGGVDTTFGTQGQVALLTPSTDPVLLGAPFAAKEIEVDATGKVTVIGAAAQGGVQYAVIAKFSAAGVPDATWGDHGAKVVWSWPGAYSFVATQVGSAWILLANIANGDVRAAKVLSDGSLDPAFGGGGATVLSYTGCYVSLSDIASQADGKVVAAGSCYPNYGAMWRIATDGSPDTDFGTAGMVQHLFFGTDAANPSIGCGSTSGFDAVAIADNQKIYVAGHFNCHLNNYDHEGAFVARFHP